MSHPQDWDMFAQAATSRIALASTPRVARRTSILRILGSRGPLAIFEIAQAMGVHDHQIAGRFCEMENYGWIEKAGERRIKPATKCAAEVYRITESGRQRIQEK